VPHRHQKALTLHEGRREGRLTSPTSSFSPSKKIGETVQRARSFPFAGRVDSCGVRSRSQRRGRDGFAPSSLWARTVQATGQRHFRTYYIEPEGFGCQASCSDEGQQEEVFRCSKDLCFSSGKSWASEAETDAGASALTVVSLSDTLTRTPSRTSAMRGRRPARSTLS
jgi:hypothetical protein